MTSEKFVAFMEKLLDCTKTGSIKWERLDIHSQLGIQNKCFFCDTKNMNIQLITPRSDPEIHFLRISYDQKIPFSDLKPGNEAEEVMMIRLFNYVYSLFPNLETAIDTFLNDF